MIEATETRVAVLKRVHARWAEYAFHLADALDDLQILIRREAALDIARQDQAHRLHFCATGVIQTAAAERLAELKCIHEEWVARLHALDRPDPDLTRAFARTLADLEILIREAEQDGTRLG